MWDLDEDRKELLHIRRMISNMERALDEAQTYELAIMQRILDKEEIELLQEAK